MAKKSKITKITKIAKIRHEHQIVLVQLNSEENVKVNYKSNISSKM